MDKIKNSLIKIIESKNNLNNKKIINPIQRKMCNPNQRTQEDMIIHLKKYQKLNKKQAFVDHNVNQNNNINQKINSKEVFEEDNINTLLKKDQKDKKNEL